MRANDKDQEEEEELDDEERGGRVRRSDEKRIGRNPQHHQSAAAATALPVVPENGPQNGRFARDILQKMRSFLFQVVLMLIIPVRPYLGVGAPGKAA